ncbi:MAG: 16S rRNA (guanine(527)-N(7))-methyltransferase RsmG [Bdellovibrionaceae bacterium]|nr:16S rRNA (guanine(527)-N(7))-methyltransferase RsmG [Bdellovibrio sp.]
MSDAKVVPNWRIKTWFPEIDEPKQILLKAYFAELLKFNKVVNLVSAKGIQNADSTHFADSIHACKIVSKNVNKNEILHDLGSGNGFPGLVYGILFPEQKIILIDTDERKCEFLKHVIDTLKLLNIAVHNRKVDLMDEGSIHQAICRGFAPLPKSLLMLRKIVKSKGIIFHLKGMEWSVEVSQIPTQLCSVWQPSLEGEYTLEGSEIKMYIVKTERIA